MLEPTARLGGYRIDALVDRASVGETYRATQIALDRPVLLHVVGPPQATDERFRARFFESARRAASLDHPNIVPVHEIGEDDGYLYLCSAYVQGRSLAEVVAEGGPLPLARRTGIVAQVADGLEAAHVSGVTHGRITTSNVLIERRDGQDHAYLTGLDMPELRPASSADDVHALVSLLEQSVGGADAELGELVSGEYPSAAAFGQAARSLAGAEVSHPPRRRRRLGWAAVSVMVVAALVAAAAVALARGRDESGSTAAGAISGEPIAAGSKALDLMVAEGSVWVQTESENLVRIDPARGQLVGLPVDYSDPTEFAVTDGEIVVGRTSGTAVRLDRETHEQVGKAIRVGPNPYSLAVDGSSLWVATFPDTGPPTTIAEFDLTTGSQRGPSIKLQQFVIDVIVAEGSIWALHIFGDAGIVARIDPETHRVLARIAIGRAPTGFASGGGSIWASNRTVGSVMRIDPSTNEVAWARAVPGVLDVAYLDGSVWALTEASLLRLDPDSGLTLGNPIGLMSAGRSLAAGEGALWVLDPSAGAVTRIEPADVAPEPTPGQTTIESPPTLPVEGPLRPGRYVTETFGVPLSMTVDDGWALLDSERPNSVWLLRASDPRHSFGFTLIPEVFSPDGREVQPAPKDLVGWFRSHPHLAVRKSTKVRIGAREAVALDLAVTSTPKPNPPECGPNPCVLLYRESENSEVSLLPAPNPADARAAPALDRFIFVEIDGRTLTAGYGTYGSEKAFKAFIPRAEKVLATVEFR